MICALVFVACIALAWGYGPEDYVHVLGATQYGFWGITDTCANGSFAYGLDIMLENEQGAFDDDTSVNALKLFCATPEGVDTGEITSSQMDRGSWRGAMMCDPGLFLKGYNIKVEDDKSDVTAANGFQFWCQGSDLALQPPENKWGDWLVRDNCTDNKVICGIMTNIQEDQGLLGDDSALNDARFLCCDPAVGLP